MGVNFIVVSFLNGILRKERLMSYFTKSIEVDTHDIDFNGVAKASAVMRYIQSAAEAQLTSAGIPYEVLKQRGRAFILSKIKIDIPDTISEGDMLTAETFPAESRGFSFLRCYRLVKDGKAIARAASVWALVDTESRMLVRVKDFELGLPTLPPLDLDIGHIDLPSEFVRVGEYRVTYADLDRNMHMNNTRYPDMYSNFLPLFKRRIRTITINYLKEARPDELLTVYLASRGDTHYIKAVRSGGEINSVAEIKLCDI